MIINYNYNIIINNIIVIVNFDIVTCKIAMPQNKMNYISKLYSMFEKKPRRYIF